MTRPDGPAPGLSASMSLTCIVISLLAGIAAAARGGPLSSVKAIERPQRVSAPDLREGYVRYHEDSKSFSFVSGFGAGPQDDAPAFGSFSDPLRHKSNFGQLRITTNPAYSDDVQMQAAGFLEGYLTAERIFDYAYNMKYWLAGQTNDTFTVGDWLFAQDKWAREQVRIHSSSSSSSSSASSSATASAASSASTATSVNPHLRYGSLTAAFAAVPPKSRPTTTGSNADPPSPHYWRAVGLLLAQSDGLLAGYSARLAELGPSPPLERLTKWDFLVLNALGDMDDLLGVIFPSTDDGSETSDYDSPSATSAQAGRNRQPNPERDASFFFRPPTPDELATAAEQGNDDLPPVVPRYGPWDGLTPEQIRSRIGKRGRCTALVKVTPGLDDLLIGHVTWWSYSSMVRIYKHYDLQLGPQMRNAAGGPVTGRVSFSSYPGQISSSDDWYILGNGLVITETSLDTYDKNRYNSTYGCTPESLLSWQRVLAANLLAADGPGWAELAAAYNGGTYNNQYMIVNLNLFVPGAELQPGLLTITEIIPGLVVTSDATQELEIGHWPSYNVPYFPEVYDALGYRRHAEALAARGAEFAAAVDGLSYQLAPRAKIFRRDAARATDLESFRRLLRSNGFGGRSSDPLSAASPWDALCARGDIDPEDPDLYGCYDGKVTNYWRALKLSADAINGPTYENGQQPFNWNAHARYRRTPHRGMIDVYETDWEEQWPDEKHKGLQVGHAGDRQ